MVQSEEKRDYYRIGMTASGLTNRLAAHARQNRKPKRSNKTEQWRPWLPVWVCTLDDGDTTLTRLAEIILELEVIKHFPLSDLTGEGSMFENSANQPPALPFVLPRIVTLFEMAFEKCVRAVGGEAVVEPWIYL